jgi:arylsulfatase A-like enzyme
MKNKEKKVYNNFSVLLIAFGFTILQVNGQEELRDSFKDQPNIIFCIADDASFEHMSAYGMTNWVKTPAFNRVAEEGLLFTKAYTPNAKCAPSRASILTGRNPWQNEAAANHNFYFPTKFTTFMETLVINNYEVGYTGKGWGPGEPGEIAGKPRMLTGQEFNDIKMAAPTKGVSSTNYTGNFEVFLNQRDENKPFFFWYGGHEPHRNYEYGSGVSKGNKQISEIDTVPPFWVDNEQVRNDMLDYAYEVEYFDYHLGEMLEVLEKSGELENTIVVVTSDNGMPFPRVKGHVYEYDNHLPLAIMWKKGIANPGRKISDFISFIDFAPTFLEIAGIYEKDTSMQPIEGKSFFDILTSNSGSTIDLTRDHVLLGRERTDVGRPNDEGYPVRSIVKGNFIYTKNYEPDRWPSGNPETGYMDTDGSPTKTAILKANRKGESYLPWELSFGKRPTEELYQINKDLFSVKNLADNPAFSEIKSRLESQMEQELKDQGDPRMFGKGYVFDEYPYAPIEVRNFYERYKKGEKMKTGWINDSDFETSSKLLKN